MWGDTRRMVHTIVGDSVRLAKVLRQNAIGDEILISKTVYDRCGGQLSVEQAPALGLREQKRLVEVFRLN